ncbi:hypothetical protein PAXRUDRAFT_178678, partial [Paxillus rubicundulus Ve08.2h10]
NNGWGYYEKIHEIFPSGGATGRSAFHASRSALPGITKSMDMVPVSPSLVVTKTSSENTTDGSAPPINYYCPNKRTLSTMSPNDNSSVASPSLLPSSSCPLVSTALTTSHQTGSKCSKVSAASGVRETNMSSGVTIVGVQGSIIHLAEMVKTSFLDPNIVIQETTAMLYADKEVSPEHWQFLIGFFMKNTSIAVIYMSIPDTTSHHSYIRDFYDGTAAPAEPVAGPSSVMLVRS